MRSVRYALLVLILLAASFFLAARLMAPAGAGGTDDQAAALARQLGGTAGEPLFSPGPAVENFLFTLGGFISGILIYHFALKIIRPEQEAAD